jgi:hypothetical protein
VLFELCCCVLCGLVKPAWRVGDVGGRERLLPVSGKDDCGKVFTCGDVGEMCRLVLGSGFFCFGCLL